MTAPKETVPFNLSSSNVYDLFSQNSLFESSATFAKNEAKFHKLVHKTKSEYSVMGEFCYFR